jgi:hypothetical protein
MTKDAVEEKTLKNFLIKRFVGLHFETVDQLHIATNNIDTALDILKHLHVLLDLLAGFVLRARERTNKKSLKKP